MLFLIIFLFILLIIAFRSIKVLKQTEVYVIERLGKFHKIADAGLTIIIPFIDHIRSVVSLKEQTMNIPLQGVATQDNVKITVDTVVFYQITAPAKAVYEIQSLRKGIENSICTAVHYTVSKINLDEIISSRELINNQLRILLTQSIDKWGCRVNRVEIKDITLPDEIRDAIEKQTNAERIKKAALLQAEGKKQAAITIAEGQKQALLIQAEAEKEAQLKRAAGEAEAIRKVALAKAQEIQIIIDHIKKTYPDDELIQTKAIEVLKEIVK